MALTSLLNLEAPIAEPAARASQNVETQAPAQSQTPLAQPVGNTANAGGRQDEFVFSNPNDQAFGQDAGLFTVKQPAVFAPAADLLLPPAGPQSTANANASNFPSTAANAVGGVLPGLAVAAGANVPATEAVGVVAAGAIGAAINAAGGIPTGTNAGATGVTALPGGAAATAGAPVGSPSVEAQLQALNVAVEALGLSPAEISKVDHIASLINDFSPTAYISLVYQLVLASTTAPPLTPNVNAEANTANAAAPPAAAAKAATA